MTTPDGAGWCGSPDCTGSCAPPPPAGLPRCVACDGVMTPGTAQVSAIVFGRPTCEQCGWLARPPATGRAW
jgi:hypothetical protein